MLSGSLLGIRTVELTRPLSPKTDRNGFPQDRGIRALLSHFAWKKNVVKWVSLINGEQSFRHSCKLSYIYIYICKCRESYNRGGQLHIHSFTHIHVCFHLPTYVYTRLHMFAYTNRSLQSSIPIRAFSCWHMFHMSTFAPYICLHLLNIVHTCLHIFTWVRTWFALSIYKPSQLAQLLSLHLSVHVSEKLCIYVPALLSIDVKMQVCIDCMPTCQTSTDFSHLFCK